MSIDLRPQSLVPFASDDAAVRDRVVAWLGKRPLAPNDLLAQAVFSTVTRVFVPFWLFTAQVSCPWQANAGSYTDRGASRENRRGRRVSWEPASGEVNDVLNDILVPASTRIRDELRTGLEPWPIAGLTAVDTAGLAGAIVETGDADPAQAATAARALMERYTRNLCELAVPGDTCSGLKVWPEYSSETRQVVLLPVWRISYSYRGKPFEVLVNGATGKTAGESPTSVAKSVFTAVVLLGLVAGGGYALWSYVTAGR